jgi:amino acid transporter
MTQAPSREDAIQQDVRDLHGLGYAQELLRSMGGFSNFAISFSIISILTGAVILYDYGLAWAGTAASLIGWPLITVFVLCIAAAMAEVASAYPTAGGLYYWASRMKNKNWGWWTAWLNLIGQFAIVAGINYAAALFLNATIITPLTGGAYSNTTVFFGDPTFGAEGPALSGALVTMAGLLAVELVLNIAGVRVVALLNQISVWWHIFFVLVIAGALFILGTQSTTQDAGLHLFAIEPVDTAGSWDNTFPVGSDHPWFSFLYGPAVSYPIFLAFFFSLLQANWTYTGYDASAHVAEETIGARRSSAWGIFLSVAVSAVAGYIFLVAITLHLPDLTPLFPPVLKDAAVYSQYYFGDGAAVLYTLNENLGAGLGGILGGGIAIAMCFCGLSSVASAGRMLFAFSRDDGIPGSGWLKKVSHRYRTPANSLTAMVIGSFILTFLAFWVGRGIAVVIVTAISTIFLYAAYAVPIYLGLTTDEWKQERVWSIGRWSRPIAIIALIWIVVLMFLFSFPTSGNISWPFMVAIVVFLLVYYFGWARSRFKGPRVMGRDDELTEIEREFEQAARELGDAPA